MRRTEPCDGAYWHSVPLRCSRCNGTESDHAPSDLHSDLHDRIWNRSKRTTVMDGAGNIHQAIVVKESDLRELTAPSEPATASDALRADAERYRWLREYNVSRQNYLCKKGIELDAAIDAALAAQEKK